MYEISDLRPTIAPKSDQMNAEQLLSGPVTITVTDVRLGSGDDQPVAIHYDNDEGRPYKPCKTMRKMLIYAWGEDGRKWAGHSMTLYNDPNVKFGGSAVGGIRISHMTGIERELALSLTATKGKKALHTIKPLQVEQSTSLANVLAAIAKANNRATMDAAKKLAAQLTRPEYIATALQAYSARVDEIKAAAAKPAAKTLEQFKQDIDNATSAETASLVIDEARDVLTPAEVDELAAAFRMAWEA